MIYAHPATHPVPSIVVYMDDPISPAAVCAEDNTNRSASVCSPADPADGVEVSALFSAVNARLSAIGGGEVRLGPGTYKLGSYLAISDSVWRGVAGKTTIVSDAVLPSVVYVGDNAVLSDVIVDANAGQSPFAVTINGDNTYMSRVVGQHSSADAFLFGVDAKPIYNSIANYCVGQYAGYSSGVPTNGASAFEIFKGANHILLHGCDAHHFSAAGYDIHDHIGELSPYDICLSMVRAHDSVAAGSGNQVGAAVYSNKNAGDVYNIDIISPQFDTLRGAFQFSKSHEVNVVGGALRNYSAYGAYISPGTKVRFDSFNTSFGTEGGSYGIWESSAGSDVVVQNCGFHHLAAYGVCIKSDGFLLDGCTFSDLTGTGAVRIDTTTGIKIRNNRFYDITTVALYPVNDVTSAEIAGNTFAATTGQLASFPTKYISCNIHDNVGFATEAAGSSTGTGSEQTIAHGLVSTPTKAGIVPTAAGATYSMRADSTNIYPTVTNLATYNWFAEV